MFWYLESLGINVTEEAVLDEFIQTIRFKEGRYEVTLMEGSAPSTTWQLWAKPQTTRGSTPWITGKSSSNAGIWCHYSESIAARYHRKSQGTEQPCKQDVTLLTSSCHYPNRQGDHQGLDSVWCLSKVYGMFPQQMSSCRIKVWTKNFWHFPMVSYIPCRTDCRYREGVSYGVQLRERQICSKVPVGWQYYQWSAQNSCFGVVFGVTSSPFSMPRSNTVWVSIILHIQS